MMLKKIFQAVGKRFHIYYTLLNPSTQKSSLRPLRPQRFKTKKPPKGQTRISPKGAGVKIRIIRVIRVLLNTKLVEVAGVEPASEVVFQWRYYAHSQTFDFIPLAPSDWISRLISGVNSPPLPGDRIGYRI